MFQIDEYVVHLTGGICRVKDIAPLEMSGADKSRNYYFLVPLKNQSSKVYVPVDNDSAIRRIYSHDEAQTLLDDIPAIKETIIENDKMRENIYKEVIKSNDLRELVGILKNLYSRRQRRINEGKKVTATDEKYYKIAEENLLSELSFALGEERASLKEKVINCIQ